MPKSVDPRKRMITIFGSIFSALLLFLFFSPIRTESVESEELKEISIPESEYFSKRISFQTGEEKTISFSIESKSEEPNPRLVPREIDILFLDEENFKRYRNGTIPEYIEEGTEFYTSSFSTEFELPERGNYHLILDNTNRFSLANRNIRSFSADRAIVSLELRTESKRSVIDIPT